MMVAKNDVRAGFERFTSGHIDTSTKYFVAMKKGQTTANEKTVALNHFKIKGIQTHYRLKGKIAYSVHFRHFFVKHPFHSMLMVAFFEIYFSFWEHFAYNSQNIQRHFSFVGKKPFIRVSLKPAESITIHKVTSNKNCVSAFLHTVSQCRCQSLGAVILNMNIKQA